MKIWAQRRVHSILKGPWCSREAKCHDTELELAKVSLEGYFKLLTRLHSDLVESGLEV